MENLSQFSSTELALQILVVAPHHDDEVIGCGGTIAYLTQKGHAVDVVYMTSGDIGVPNTEKLQAREIRESEATKSCEVLGVRNKWFLRGKDRDISYSLEKVKNIVEIIRKGGYQGVLFPHGNEQDREHRIIHDIVGEATWLSASPYFPELGSPTHLKYLLMYEVWTPLSSYHMKFDISDFLETKITALSQHKSQFSLEQAKKIVGLNLYRAAMHSSNAKAIEVFKYYTRE
ncbi:MAG: PIG-L family deacetylase [Bacteroidetes bacterium]|jgi:N-acetylglucosamine malate deacetylase 1|nr:PIG-L family deacetylase [Bacteroidota bacterium]